MGIILEENSCSQKKLTTEIEIVNMIVECPGVDVLKLLSGKWKPQILGLATRGNVRFNTLLRQLPGSNKQSLSVALRELEDDSFLTRQIITEKPLHVEYSLTANGQEVIRIFQLAGSISHKINPLEKVEIKK